MLVNRVKGSRSQAEYNQDDVPNALKTGIKMKINQWKQKVKENVIEKKHLKGLELVSCI